MYPIVSDRSYVVYVEYLLLTARNHLREFTVGMVVSLALVTAFLFFFLSVFRLRVHSNTSRECVRCVSLADCDALKRTASTFAVQLCCRPMQLVSFVARACHDQREDGRDEGYLINGLS